MSTSSYPPPPSLGVNKAIAAGVPGAITLIIVYGLSFAHITPPVEIVAAVQTLVTLAAVYLTPHGA